MTALTAPTDTRSTLDVERLSTRFGLAFPLSQVVVMIVMALLVLPNAGSPDDPPLERGARMLEGASAYKIGNFVFMIAGTLLLGFLGAVHLRLRRADGTGVLATVAVAAGTLLALIWPLAAVLHDVTVEAASAGGDLATFAGWDAVAPFSLSFSVLPRVFFIGAVVLGLRAENVAPGLRRMGLVLIAISLVGSATLVAGGLFPVLALSTLGFDLWLGALAWHWLRRA
ncbi:hypothetical protein [Cellulomonas sp. URHD0024]|uniref:hypothetical protein n=1 Tax=Cellulomonas sp. URHD0024 TaxID=1302620 RepID=UPI00042652B7|nr:hypothetical protein [Cellulomonas sp. URHD0024]